MRKIRARAVSLLPLAWVLLATVLPGCNTSGLDWRDSVSRKVERGNVELEAGRTAEALNAYRDAQIDAPEDQRIHYNIGNTLYRERKYDEATQAYGQAQTTRDSTLRARAAYNQGNVWFRQNRLDMAAENYQRALELDPTDMDAKFNLELVQRMLAQAAERSEQEDQDQQNQRPRVSDWARQRAREAEALARQGFYAQADQVMQRTMQSEPAAQGEYGDFANRLHELAQILGGAQ